MATTTLRDDFLGRDLQTPATNSLDHVGRATTSTADYLGRPLYRALRVNSTAYNLGDALEFTGGEEFEVTVAGTTAVAEPAAPAVGATVADGGATLLRTS